MEKKRGRGEKLGEGGRDPEGEALYDDITSAYYAGHAPGKKGIFSQSLKFLAFYFYQLQTVLLSLSSRDFLPLQALLQHQY